MDTSQKAYLRSRAIQYENLVSTRSDILLNIVALFLLAYFDLQLEKPKLLPKYSIIICLVIIVILFQLILILYSIVSIRIRRKLGDNIFITINLLRSILITSITLILITFAGIDFGVGELYSAFLGSVLAYIFTFLATIWFATQLKIF
eukprot:EST47728.1 Transmembrane domain-containing protein [Spironucleus salmonicida]